ncbi:uncharacterized protein N7469_009565 [Penicillium citrinum]|uniref:Uncharacterized protein n=1 Tax=Penicillium citrinum TaxID=5077 RepID=A0A9W9NJ18_PENCI|nr:uncharacterized protein N7469_009565 [Penicillium citrinum]KAJ5220678.1 hypothetical protein N7469_009565 [Penicillium citrinum]KAK5798656.1 hypothetical protein VI817_004946 [Penicillium citrinum]
MTGSTTNPNRGNRRRPRGQAQGRASRGNHAAFSSPILDGEIANCRLLGQTVSSSSPQSPPTGIFTSMWASPAPASSSQSEATPSAAPVIAFQRYFPQSRCFVWPFQEPLGSNVRWD